MTGQDIIDKFNLFVDDQSELSSSEELDLLNDKYYTVCDDRDWEWLKATYTGTSSASVAYVALPTTFKKLSPNKDNKSVVFVGTDYSEYQVIPFSSRRDYRDQDGFCYLDMVNRRLYFTLQPTAAEAIEYDYISKPTALTVSTEPIITTERFGTMLAHAMATEFPSIEQSNKLTSYQSDYAKFYADTLHDLALEDALIKLSI